MEIITPDRPSDPREAKLPSAVTFDKSGELNAYSKQDAMRNIMKYAGMLATASDPTAYEQERFSEAYTLEQQGEMVQKIVSSQQSRLALGQAMANPIRRFLDYRGVMRRALKVDPLAQGAIPVYDRDVEDIAAVVVSANGSVPESKHVGKRFEVSLFDIDANPTVTIREVKTRRFNLLDRIQVKTRQFIQEQEDENIINALRTASTVENTLQTANGIQAIGGTATPGGLFIGGTVGRFDIVAIKRQVEQWDLFAQNIFTSIYRFNDFLLWNVTEVDPVTQKQLLDTGLMAKIFNVNVYVTKKIPINEVYITATPELVGVYPVLQDIEVLPADEPRQKKFGWVFNQIVGIFISNPRGVARLVIP